MFIILWFGTLKLVYPRHFLLKCLYQVRMVSGHVWVCYEYRFRLFLRFSYWILEVFLFLSSFLSEAQKSTYRQMNSSLQRRGLFASYENKCLDESMMRSDLSNVYLYTLYFLHYTSENVLSKLRHSREEKEV